MTSAFDLKYRDYCGSAAGRQEFNRALFTEVAGHYDYVTTALSFGQDAHWKRCLIDALPPGDVSDCLDIACGTGHLTRLLARRYPSATVTGLDLTPAMLALATSLTPDGPISYREGSMAQLPFAPASMDIVTGGYALRNAPDFGVAVRQIARVLRPGGVAAFLDFSKPGHRFGQALGHILLRSWGGFWGLLLHGNPDVYAYIADSLALFPDRIRVRTVFEAEGLVLRSSRRFFGGLLELLVLQKGYGC